MEILLKRQSQISGRKGMMNRKTDREKENQKMWAGMTRKTRKRLRKNARAVAEYRRTHPEGKRHGHKL